MSGGVVIIAVGVLAVAAWLAGRLCSVSCWPRPVDHPNDRSLHARPTPRTGGLAIWGGLAFGLVGGVLLERAGMHNWSIDWAAQAGTNAWIASMAVLVGVVSFFDDCKGLSVGIRLAVHAIAACGVVLGAGLVASLVTIPIIGVIQLGVLAAPMTVLFIVWMANLYNFMDGMDGFSGGMTWLGFGFLSGLAWISGHEVIFLLSLLISTAASGFLFYNLPPAKIFMGDVGSVPIGFLAASLAVLGVHDGIFDLWVPILIFSPFIVDATVTVMRRMLQGQQFWCAHRQHYYQRLVLAGWGHRKTVLAEYVLMVVTGLTAVIYSFGTDQVRLAILLAWVIAYVVLAWVVRMMEQNPGGRVSKS